MYARIKCWNVNAKKNVFLVRHHLHLKHERKKIKKINI